MAIFAQQPPAICGLVPSCHGHWVSCSVVLGWAAVIRGAFGAGSGFRVGWCTAWGSLISVFRGFFASIGGAFVLAWGLGVGLSFLGFKHLRDLF